MILCILILKRNDGEKAYPILFRELSFGARQQARLRDTHSGAAALKEQLSKRGRVSSRYQGKALIDAVKRVCLWHINKSGTAEAIAFVSYIQVGDEAFFYLRT